MKYSFVLLLFFVSTHFLALNAQMTKIDSLQNLLATHQQVDTFKVNLLIELAKSYKKNSNNRLITAQKAITIAEKLNFQKGKALLFKILSNYYYYQSNYQKSIEYSKKALEIAKKNNDKILIADCLNSIGFIYDIQGSYVQALNFYQKSLKVNEEIKDQEGISTSLMNIGVIHDGEGDYKKALKYYQKSLKISEDIDDKYGVIICLLNIGGIEEKQGEYDNSFKHVKKALRIAKETKDRENIAYCLEAIGKLYQEKRDYTKAIQNYNKALDFYQEINSKYNTCRILRGFSVTYLKTKKYKKALGYAQKSLKIANELGLLEDQRDIHELLSRIYEATNEYKKAHQNYKQYKILNDSLFNEKNTKQITGLEYQYKHDKEKQLIALEQTKKDAVQEIEAKDQRKIRNLLILGILLTILLVFIAIYGFFQKKKANEILTGQKQKTDATNEELSQINEELNTTVETVNQQKYEIEKSHQKTQASISYASRIQAALLPSQKLFASFFSEHFVLFKPKDIVSGDFYYLKKVNNFLVIAVADCTGHGVPGAFVSLLGISFLNEIVAKKEIKTAAGILEELRKQVKNSLKQTEKGNNSKDGMDIALCIIDTKTSLLQFAGAYNPLFIIRDKKMIEIKGTKNPIGVHLKEKSFENHTIQLQKSDDIYLFSDGYIDQFGGEKNMKFMSKRFKDLLLKINHEPYENQKELVNTEFEDWKGNQKQIDDVTVLGFRI